MPSRQFVHLRRKSLDALNGTIPSECPVKVELDADQLRFAVVEYPGHQVLCVGRYEVVYAYLAGYLHAWKRHDA